MDIVSTKKTSTIATKKTTNITSAASIHYHNKKLGDCYILHAVLVLLLLIIIIIRYYYAKQKSTI